MAKEPKPKDVHRLSNEHRLILLLAHAEAEVARVSAERSVFELKSYVAAAKLQIMQLEQECEKRSKELGERAKTADQAAYQAKEQHRLVAQKLAKQYNFDWQTTGFDPDTGVLLPNAEGPT